MASPSPTAAAAAIAVVFFTTETTRKRQPTAFVLFMSSNVYALHTWCWDDYCRLRIHVSNAWAKMLGLKVISYVDCIL